MAVTIADSVGYEGTINEAQWAQLMAYAGGRQYGVVGTNDWKVTVGTADREVRIAPGVGFGSGILDRTTATASLTLPATTSGSRWHLIAARRDWQANETTFDSIAGGTTPALPNRSANPGVADDHPIALVRVAAGQSQIAEIRDLRVWTGDAGARAVDELVLQFLNRIATRVRIGSVDWVREVDVLGAPYWSRDVPLNVVTDNNAIAGTAWDGESPLLVKYLSGSPQVDANSVTTLTFPGGAFPHGVLFVDPQILTGNGAKLWTVAEVTKSRVRIQLLNESGGALPAGTPVPLAVRVDGW